MSQVSLLFKDRILSIHQLNQFKDFIIGHAADCQIRIDSLAVGSHHARISYDDRTYWIETLEDELEDKLIVQVNNNKIDSLTQLSDSDKISLGKHTLIFTFDERNETHEFREPAPAPVQKDSKGKGWLQFLNGQKMGKTLQIKKGMTHVSDEQENNIALISNRSDGFYISYLKGKQPPEVNNVSIGEKSAKLTTNSRISLGTQDILFYVD